MLWSALIDSIVEKIIFFLTYLNHVDIDETQMNDASFKSLLSLVYTNSQLTRSTRKEYKNATFN